MDEGVGCTPEGSSDSALESDIRESCVRLRAKSSEVSNSTVGGSELVSGRRILPPFVTGTHCPDGSYKTFVQPRGSLQTTSQQLSSNKPRDHCKTCVLRVMSDCSYDLFVESCV